MPLDLKQKKTTTTARSLVLLSPTTVTKMLRDRRKFQVVKFRTTCADCLPNY